MGEVEACTSQREKQERWPAHAEGLNRDGLLTNQTARVASPTRQAAAPCLPHRTSRACHRATPPSSWDGPLAASMWPCGKFDRVNYFRPSPPSESLVADGRGRQHSSKKGNFLFSYPC